MQITSHIYVEPPTIPQGVSSQELRQQRAAVRGSIVGTHRDLEEVFELHRRGLTKVEREERRLEDVNEAIEQAVSYTHLTLPTTPYV